MAANVTETHTKNIMMPPSRLQGHPYAPDATFELGVERRCRSHMEVFGKPRIHHVAVSWVKIYTMTGYRAWDDSWVTWRIKVRWEAICRGSSRPAPMREPKEFLNKDILEKMKSVVAARFLRVGPVNQELEDRSYWGQWLPSPPAPIGTTPWVYSTPCWVACPTHGARWET